MKDLRKKKAKNQRKGSCKKKREAAYLHIFGYLIKDNQNPILLTVYVKTGKRGKREIGEEERERHFAPIQYSYHFLTLTAPFTLLHPVKLDYYNPFNKILSNYLVWCA